MLSILIIKFDVTVLIVCATGMFVAYTFFFFTLSYHNLFSLCMVSCPQNLSSLDLFSTEIVQVSGPFGHVNDSGSHWFS